MSRNTHNKYIEVQSLLKMIPNRVLYVGNIKNNRIYNPALNRAGLELDFGKGLKGKIRRVNLTKSLLQFYEAMVKATIYLLLV